MKYGFNIEYTEDQLDRLHINYEQFMRHEYLPEYPRIEVITNLLFGRAYGWFLSDERIVDPYQSALILTNTYEETTDLMEYWEKAFNFSGAKTVVEKFPYQFTQTGTVWCLRVTYYVNAKYWKAYCMYFLKKSRMYQFSEEARHIVKFDDIIWATSLFSPKDMYCVQLFANKNTELFYCNPGEDNA